ncbi:MAG TPA: methyl-accepting chemotaxis protein [Desulfuromonadales bacterium]|nr:methyl-accepting chemotaxis protein [Desulfuromonadales bacterium]
MKDMKIAYKIFLQSLIVILVFTVMIGWVYQQLKDRLDHDKKSEVQHAVESAWGVVEYFAKQQETGALTRDQAQHLAKAALNATRYDGDNYFWINDLAPRMVMHPIKPALDGKDLANVKDPTGKALFVEAAKVAKTDGGGFISYEWSKPGFDKPVPKISFVKLVPQWGWVIGSGIYLDDVQAVLNHIFYLVAGVTLVAILAVLLLVGLLTRSIAKPMGQAVAMIHDLEKGRLNRRLHLDRKDEIGIMAKAMDDFADSLEEEMVAGLQKLADGDLTFTIVPRDGEDRIRGALRTVGERLNHLLQQIQTAGEQIAAGSVQVSDSSQTLSQGATEQASSLEEITSSMVQSSEQVRVNAENANQAARLAAQVRTEAEEGNAQMQQMVAAMSDISDSSQNISKIIKVIDEIAFQTNLLALNAAVEAARAGVHGKGFAVVAEEVRNLAARSAKAARETAELIEGSVQKTDHGAKIASHTAEALQEIVNDVTKVTDLVAEIAAASNEQAQGIAEVNQGLSQIDQVTQQNTASAEESAAAAEELSSQAEQLRQMLGGFRLKEGSLHHDGAPKLPHHMSGHHVRNGEWPKALGVAALVEN